MAKNITIIPASGSINFISSGSSSTIELLITGSNNEILTFYTGSTPILSINSTSGFSTAQPPSFNNLSSVPSSSNYIVYDTGSGAISYTTGVGGSGTSGTSGATGTSGTSGTGSPGTSGTSGNSGTSGISGSSGSSGTSADLSAYVPYTGSTTSVNLGANNLTVDTNTFFVDATNNRVGIGTATPNNALTVSSNGTSYSNAGFIAQFYQGTTNTDVKIIMADIANAISITYGATSSSFTQWAGFTMGSGNAPFRVWGSDNIGIGYTNGNLVTNKFQVSGNSRIDGLLRFFTDTSAAVALKRNGTELQVRLADDSGFAPIQALGGTFNSRIKIFQTDILVTNMTTAVNTSSFIGALVGATELGVLMGADQSGFGFIQGRYSNTAEQLRMQLFGNGISIGSSTGTGWLSIGSTNQLALSRLGIPIAPTASANYGLVSLGSGAFDGATSGFFTGVAAGTVIAVNLASGGTSDLLNMQVAGVNRFKVSSVGQATISGNLVVDTNTLFVDATNDRVGIGDAAPAARLTINSSGGATDLLGLNVAGVRKFRVTNLGVIGFSSNNTSISEGASTGLDFYTNVAPAATQSAFNFAGRTSTNATGESTHFDMGGKNGSATTGFSRSSGTGTWIGGRLDYTINNTGTYSGTVTGFYLNATETSITGTTHNLLNLLVGGSSRFLVNNAGNVTAAAATFSGNLVVDTNTFVVDATNNRVGIGTATPSYPLDIISTATNQFVVQSTGTATDSRAAMLFSNNRASFASVAAFLYGNTTNTTSKLGQTMADKFFIIADGANNLGMAIGTNGSVPLFLATADTTRLTVTSDGLLAFGTDTTSAFPALKRNSTELQVRLADDSGFAPFQASQLTIDAGDIITDTITGMKIGTGTTQKLGFWNATPIIQPISGGPAAVFVANTSLIADDSATFDGYTIGQVVKALRDMGILA